MFTYWMLFLLVLVCLLLKTNNLLLVSIKTCIHTHKLILSLLTILYNNKNKFIGPSLY